jgi:hypothetical protein
MLSIALFAAILFLLLPNNSYNEAQNTFARTTLSNESNRVVSEIISNLGSNNPDRVVGGFHALSFNVSKSKPDIPAPGENNFLVAQEKDFKIFLSPSWIKNTAP